MASSIWDKTPEERDAAREALRSVRAFPIGENIPCTIIGCRRNKTFAKKFDVIQLTFKTEMEGPLHADPIFKTLNAIFFVPKEGSSMLSFFRSLFHITRALGVDPEDNPMYYDLEDKKGVFTTEELEEFIPQYKELILKHSKKNVFIKTVIVKDKKGKDVIRLGKYPFISDSDDLEYRDSEK